ncbi:MULTISPECIES: hypothetical protein [unclassified Chryseobacterium]|uniref:hypothetical protein n=1 Tax=unclassified Chryseobacterium TaxID=2593645 RepID=UPI00100A775B|nr:MULTISPECIES: hypothetical protein [unclassified Chryseobacterium]RXM52561.1 hypothetical protein BOQ64_06780 [Chryseobacterium sp. CH25]RXM66617.1 hypothetical protein BOQ60_01255 [Chryseobacterium sp. CH1]
MCTIIKVKNRINWLVTFITSLALIVFLFIIIILIPLVSVKETYFLSVINYLINVIPFVAFFTLFLYFWLWNTFGKTLLIVEQETITIKYKNKLFVGSKIFLKQEIKDIQTIDFKIEKYQFGTRYHFSWVDATYSVVFINNNGEKRIIDWITKEKADEVTERIKKVWYQNNV